jgi:hypothetical protein
VSDASTLGGGSQCLGERARLKHDARLTKRRRNAGSVGYRQLARRRLITGRPDRFQNSAPFAQLNAPSGGRRATDSPWRHDCWRGSQRPGLRSYKPKREPKRSWNCCSSLKRNRVESSRHLHSARAKASLAHWYAITRKSQFVNFVQLRPLASSIDVLTAPNPRENRSQKRLKSPLGPCSTCSFFPLHALRFYDLTIQRGVVLVFNFPPLARA